MGGGGGRWSAVLACRTEAAVNVSRHACRNARRGGCERERPRLAATRGGAAVNVSGHDFRIEWRHAPMPPQPPQPPPPSPSSAPSPRCSHTRPSLKAPPPPPLTPPASRPTRRCVPSQLGLCASVGARAQACWRSAVRSSSALGARRSRRCRASLGMPRRWRNEAQTFGWAGGGRCRIRSGAQQHDQRVLAFRPALSAVHCPGGASPPGC